MNNVAIAIKLKDTQENANFLCDHLKRTDVLTVVDFEQFVDRLLGLYQRAQIPGDTNVYLYTDVLFQDALYSYIDYHFDLMEKSQLSRTIFRHFVTLFITAQNALGTVKPTSIGELIIVPIPMTQYSFRLHSKMLADARIVSTEVIQAGSTRKRA